MNSQSHSSLIVIIVRLVAATLISLFLGPLANEIAPDSKVLSTIVFLALFVALAFIWQNVVNIVFGAKSQADQNTNSTAIEELSGISWMSKTAEESLSRVEILETLSKNEQIEVAFGRTKDRQQRVIVTRAGQSARSDVVATMKREREVRSALKDLESVGNIVDCGVDSNKRPYIATSFQDGQSLLSVAGQITGESVLKLAQNLGRQLGKFNRRSVLLQSVILEDFTMNSNGEINLGAISNAFVLNGKVGAPKLTSCDLRTAAPELLNGAPASQASEVFSFGAAVYELMTGAAFRTQDEIQAKTTDYKRILSSLDQFESSKNGKVLSQIIKQCIKYRLSDRPSRLSSDLLKLPKREPRVRQSV